jgi:hypothetical protein
LTHAKSKDSSPARRVGKRQEVAITSELDLSVKQRPRIPRIVGVERRPWLFVFVAAVLILGIGVAVWASLSSGALTLFGPSGPSATATASALAFRSAFFATQIAQLTQDYRALGVGPCDTTDPPYNNTHSYWDWMADVRCVDSVARMYSGGVLEFYGRPAGFPKSYQISVTFTLHASSDNICVDLSVARAVSSPNGSITLCNDGGWADARGKHTGTPATSYTVSATVTPTSTAISVNGALRVPSDSADGQTYNIYMSVSSGPASDFVDVSNFVLHPTY